MVRNGILRIIGGVGVVACLVGLFANMAATPAAYALLDALFVGGAAMAIVPAMLINK